MEKSKKWKKSSEKRMRVSSEEVGVERVGCPSLLIL